LYSPTLFDSYSDFKHQPAAGYAIEVVRRPYPGIYTCLGGGYTASGPVEPNKGATPWLPVGAKLTKEEAAGEVQTPIEYHGTETLDLGSPVFMRHAKAGELMERFNEIYLVTDGKIVETVATYRGDGNCFL
jgi:D-serine deaminase-like pyridoxal phosphate-dependent protein